VLFSGEGAGEGEGEGEPRIQASKAEASPPSGGAGEELLAAYEETAACHRVSVFGLCPVHRSTRDFGDNFGPIC